MRRFLPILTLGLVLVACGGSNNASNAAPSTTTTTERVTTTTVNPVAGLCLDVIDVAASTNDSNVSSRDWVERMLAAVQPISELDWQVHPELVNAADTIIAHLTWGERTADEFERTGNTLLPLDPQEFTNALVVIADECRAILNLP